MRPVDEPTTAGAGDEARFAHPLAAGLKGRCPRCGRGRLFAGFLSLRQDCESCGLDFGFSDSGDGPAFFIMTFVGFVVAGGALMLEVAASPPFWLHAVLWIPLTLALSLLLLRPLKGLMIALQYRHDAREGALSPTDDPLG